MELRKKPVLSAFLFFAILAVLSVAVDAADDVCSTTYSCPAGAAAGAGLGSDSENGTCIYFFYGQNCLHCARIEPFIYGLQEKYPEISIKAFEVYFSAENQTLFSDFNRRYSIVRQGVPSVFIGDRAFVGEQAIQDNLEQSILYYEDHAPICPEKYNSVEAKPHDISPSTRIQLTLPVIITAALVDSINPCAFSVLIFLLVYLMALGARRKILKVGLTYIMVIFFVYFFSGLGLFSIIQTTNMTRLVYTAAAVISILAGLINVKDFFWYGKGFSLSIPESKKPLIEKYIKQATIPAAIILGVLVSMFELPCTGGVYLAILGLLSSQMTLWQGVPYLLLYNFIFILPLVFILLIVYRGISPESVEKWRLDKRKWMKLAMGLVMIALGIIMLKGWI